MPNSTNNSTTSQEIILRKLLKGTLILGAISLSIDIIYFIKSLFVSNIPYYGENPLDTLIFVMFFGFLYIIVEQGHHRFAAIIFIATYVAVGFYSSLRWGADIPFSFLIYALAVVIAGIVIDGKSAILVNVIIIIGLLLIIYGQTNHYVEFDYSWSKRQLDIIDGIVFGLILSIISLVSWLSNKEINKALQRARESEEALIIERNSLELRVRQRSRQLETARIEKIMQLYKLAELGKLAAGLMHDLVNPLASVSANLEQLHEQNNSAKKKQISAAIKRAVAGTKEMENYVQATRKQIQRQEIIKTFYVSKAIHECIKLFSYRAKTENISVRIERINNVALFGNVVKFHQLMNNLISNAFDALSQSKKTNKILRIVIKSIKGDIVLKVIDNGDGISDSEMTHIFDPFFTTKKEKGTGIGLSITKDIVENTFNGQISVLSNRNSGTSFVITLPTAKTV